MDGLQEQICSGCEFYEDNYKKALDRFLLYKEKIMCTQTLIQKYERRKQHNQQLIRKLQKSRQNVAAVRERFMHYMEKYMPLEKSYNDLKAAHADLDDKMHTQSTTLIALQQHNKQLTALVEVQEKEVNECKNKSEKLEEELKRKLRISHIAKVKANDKYRNLVKAAVELAVVLKDKGLLPDSYKLCLRSWKKQLSQDIKAENFCDNGGLSPDKASSISSQDTGFDSSKSMSDDENAFDENVMRRKGAAGDNGCNNTLKSAAASSPLEKSLSDKSVNTSDIVRNFSTSCVSFENLRDIGVNTSVSMLTSDLSKFLHEVAINDFKNSGQSSPDQEMENQDLKALPFDTDSQIIEPHSSHRGSIFSPLKGAVHSASAEKPPTNAEKPPTSVEMPPSNDCVEEFQSKFVQPGKHVFTNSDSSKTIPPHLKDPCVAGKSLSVLFASEVPVFGEGHSFHERDKREEEERRGGLGGGREGEEELRGEEEELGEGEEELGLGVGVEGEGEEEEEEEEDVCYDDGCNDGANNISSHDHEKGRNLLTGREDIHNAWNRRMQTALCLKVPFRGAHTAESRVESIFQEMKLFAPRLVSPMSACSDEIPAKTRAVSASPQMCSTDLGTHALSSVKCDSFQADFADSHTCSNNNSVFQQQPVQSGNMKKENLMLLRKRNSLQKKSISIKTPTLDTEGTDPNHKIEIEPLKRVCHKECSSKYSSVLEKFSIGKDVSTMLHSPSKEKMKNSKSILPDPKHTDIFAPDVMKSLNHLTSIIASKKFLKFIKKNNFQRSRKLRKNILKTVRSPKKHFVTSKPSSSYSNIVETASGCFLETVNDTPIFVHSAESTPESGKFEESLAVTETVNCRQEEPSAAVKVSDRKREISQLQWNSDTLALKKQQKEGRNRLRVRVSQEVEKSKVHAETNILLHETYALTPVTQNKMEHKESLKSDVLAHAFQLEVDNQSTKSLEKDEKDTKNVVKALDMTDNLEGTVSNSECSSAIKDTLLFSTNNNSAELKRRDTDSESCLVYKELLDDLSVSDDDSSPKSINVNSELSHCVEAEGSNDESSSDSEIDSNNFPKTDVPQHTINNETKCELLNHDIIGREKDCDKQYNSESIVKVSEHSNVKYFIPQIVNGNESVINYEETKTNIPTECRQEICVPDQSVDLLDQKYDSGHEVQKINLICEVGEPVSELSTCLSVSCDTDGKTMDTEVSFSPSNNDSYCSTSEVITVNDTKLEMNSVSSSKISTDFLTQPEVTNDCASQVSVSANTEDCTMNCSGVFHDHNTKIFIRDSEVNLDKDVAKHNSLAPNKCDGKKMDSTDTPDMPNVDNELSKGTNGTHRCTSEEQQESNKVDIPVEKIPPAELDISKQEVGDVKDTAEPYCEEYYMPQRTKKRIAHKPKPHASGSGISSEDKNFESPTKATRKRTPRKIKPTTEDEQRNTKTVKTRAQSSSSKHLAHTVNEIGRDMQSSPLNVTTNNKKEKCTSETKCSSNEVTESVNFVSEARNKLKTEVASDTDPLENTARKRRLKMTGLDDKQLESSSIHLQVARRSTRLKKSTLKILQNGWDIHATKRRKNLKDEKHSADDSVQDVTKIDSVKTDKCDDGRSSADVYHIKEEKCDTNEVSLAGEPVSTVQNSNLEKLLKSEVDTDDGAAGPLIGGSKRKIKNETGSEKSRKKLAPCLFEKQSCYKTELKKEANFPIQSSTSEDAFPVSCKSEIHSLCSVPLPSDKNTCEEECIEGNTSTSASHQLDKGGSVTSFKSRTSSEEARSNIDTGQSNGECIYVHNNNVSDIKSECINVSYAKGDVIKKCLAIQQRNKLAARRPTRKILNQQEVFVSHQLSQMLEGDFTSEILDTAVEKFGQDDTSVDAVALVRCILKVLLKEECNEIDRSHDIRAPPLSVVEEKLMTLMITLRNRCSRFSTLINDFLTAVEYYILNLRTTPEYDLLYILTRFHAAVCKAEGFRERAQAFCYDALYCLKRKCFPVIYTILIYYPEVFPRASIGMSSPVCVSIVYSIFTSMNQAVNVNLRIKPLITLLCRIYDYKLAEVLSFDLVNCFLNHLKCQSPKSGEVCAAITLLAKRNDKTWTLTQLIPKYLRPIIQEWRHGKINEAVISDVIDVIGCVMKPFSEESDIGPVLKIFKGILHADGVTQTLKMKAALNLARQTCHHFTEVAPTLFEWIPEGGLPDEFWEQMSDILSVKPRNHWTSFLSTFEENTEEMCVGVVNN